MQRYRQLNFQSLTEVAKHKLSEPNRGLESILRPDKPGVIHKTGLVPNHSVFCKYRPTPLELFILEKRCFLSVYAGS